MWAAIAASPGWAIRAIPPCHRPRDGTARSARVASGGRRTRRHVRGMTTARASGNGDFDALPQPSWESLIEEKISREVNQRSDTRFGLGDSGSLARISCGGNVSSCLQYSKAFLSYFEYMF